MLLTWAVGLGLLAGPAPAAPSNDSRATPALLPGIEEVRTVDLAGATVEAGEPSHVPPWEGGIATRSVWHAWRAPADGSLLFSVGGSAAASAFAVVYDPSAGFPMGGLGWTLGERTAITAVSAGSSYLLAVGDQIADADEVTLRWRFLKNPDNDTWTLRQPLPADGTPVPGWPALTRPDDFEAAIGAGNLVWYEWTAPGTGRAVVQFTPGLPATGPAPLLVFRDRGPRPGIEVPLPDAGLPVIAGEILRIGVKRGDSTPGPFEIGVRLDTARLVTAPAAPVDTDPSIRVRVEVTSFDGEIREVEFHRDGRRFAVDSTPPFEVTLETPAVGRVELSAALVRRDGSVRWVPAESVEIRPSNDDFAKAIPLTGGQTTATVDLTTATAEPGEPSHGGNPAHHSVWWSWTPPRSGVVRLSVFPTEPNGLTYSVAATVYNGDSLETLRPIQTNDLNYLWVPVTGGVPYHIALDAVNSSTMRFTVELDLSPPLPNDAFAAATPLTGEQLAVTAPSGAATVEPGEPAPNGGSIRSLWWTWTAPADGFVTLQPGATTAQTTVEAYAGNTLGSLVRQQPGAGIGLLRLPVMAGTRLSIRAFPTWLGEILVGFDLSFERPPANDFRAAATVIDHLPFHLTGNLRDSTAEPGEEVHVHEPSTRTLWYRWTPVESGPVALERLDTSPGYTASLYREDDRDPLVSVWGSAGGIDSRVNVSAGTTYWIVIDSHPFASADLPFSLNLLPPPPNDSLGSGSELSGWAAHVDGYNLLATREPGEPVFSPGAAGQTVWYGWTAPGTGLATVRVQGPAQVRTAAFTGDTVSTLKPADPVWNSAGDEGVRLIFSAIAGTHYWIGVDAGTVPSAPGFPDTPVLGRFELQLGLSQWRVITPVENVVLTEGADLPVEALSSSGSVGDLAEWQFRLDGRWNPEATSPPLTAPPFRHTYSNLAAGEYTVMFVGTGTNGAPHSSRPVAFRVAPPNDTMVGATPVPQLPFFANGLFDGTVEEPGEPVLAGQTAPGSRWWTWVAPRTGVVSVELHGALGVFARTASPALEPVASFGHAGTLTSTGTFSVTAGQTYLLKVAPRKTPETPAEAVEHFSYTLAWQPEYDAFANPGILEGTQLTLNLDHTAATAEPDEPVSASQPPRRSLWQAWTAPADGWLLLKGGPAVSVFTGSALTALTRVVPAFSSDPAWPFRFPVRGGETYRLSFDYFEDTLSVMLAEWRLQFVGPQPHDAFAGRLTVTGLPADLTGINLGATREAGEPTRQIEPGNGRPSALIGNTLWFAWTSPVNGTIEIRQSPESRRVLAEVFTGDRLETLQNVRPDSPLPGVPEIVSFVAEAGRTYAISVGCLAGQEGGFQLHIVGPPPNDEFATATPVPADATTINVNLDLATVQPTDPETVPVNGGSVWFRWTAPARGRVTLNLSPWDSSRDPSIWIGDTLDGLRRVDSPDRRGRFRAEAGTPYFFFFRGYGDRGFPIPLLFEPPLPNDDFAEATPLAGTAIEAGGETRGATAEAGETERSVWWRWTAPDHGQLWVTPLAGEPVVLFRGTGVGQLIRQTVLPDGAYRVGAGQEFYLRASDLNGPEPVRFRLRWVADPAAQLGKVSWSPDDGLHLSLRGRPGQTVELERSTDLLNWLPAGRRWLLLPDETWTWPVGDSAQEFLRERLPGQPQ